MTGIFKGSNELLAGALRVGDTVIQRVYLGSAQLWPPPVTYTFDGTTLDSGVWDSYLHSANLVVRQDDEVFIELSANTAGYSGAALQSNLATRGVVDISSTVIVEFDFRVIQNRANSTVQPGFVGIGSVSSGRDSYYGIPKILWGLTLGSNDSVQYPECQLVGRANAADGTRGSRYGSPTSFNFSTENGGLNTVKLELNFVAKTASYWINGSLSGQDIAVEQAVLDLMTEDQMLVAHFCDYSISGTGTEVSIDNLSITPDFTVA